MQICVPCKTEMYCTKTGAQVHFGGGHVYSGDAFKCPNCGCEVVVCGKGNWYQADFKDQVHYVEMNGEEAHGSRQRYEEG